ncbi:MAG: hypothetical protein O7D32_05155 [bacterium]|nr:hypothetical protein [bacterium]
MFRRQLILFALLTACVCSSAFGQASLPKVPDLEGLLAKPFGTRNLGMGWGGVADGTVAATIYYNPANMLALGGFEFSAETQNWFDELDFFNAGGASRFRFAVGQSTDMYISTGLWYADQVDTHQDSSKPPPDNNVETSDRYLNLALALGLGTKRFDFGIGGAVKPVWLKFGSFDQKTTVVAYDVGAYIGGTFDIGYSSLTTSVGASILNAGNDAKADSVTSELPTEARVGVSLVFRTEKTFTRGQSGISMLEVYLNAEIVGRAMQRETNLGSGPENPPLGSSIGIEARLINTFNFRMGWLDDGVGGKVRSETWGIGIQFGSPKFRLAADLGHIPEINQGGPSVTATALTIAWYF